MAKAPPDYQIEISEAAERDLKGLKGSPAIQKRLVQKINSLAKNPRPSGAQMLEGGARNYRVRVGDYRIIYSVDDQLRRIRIQRIRHRKEVYKH